MRLLRLFNEPLGRAALKAEGVSAELADGLDLLGISGVANLIASIKFAKYMELNDNEYVVTVATDSMDLYGSRLNELTLERGVYSGDQAQKDLDLLFGITLDHMKELTYYQAKSIHNLKYFTWIEQQGREVEELNAQWYDHGNYWEGTFAQVEEIDRLITEFNTRVGG